MFHIILFQPEIPPNTGNIIRLCANTGATLHLVHPLGFGWEDKQLKRAGLDYHEFATVTHHETLEACLHFLKDARVFALTSKGKTVYSDIVFKPNDAFLFGPETRGLSKECLEGFEPERQLVIPQLAHARSLNLSNSVSVVIYEAWRQLCFK